MRSLYIVFLLLGSTAGAAPDSSVYDLPKVVAVQNRAYQVNSELSGQIGYLPSDAFNKGYTLGASYTTFFSDFLGWEVVNANYVINSPTNLKKDLNDCCAVQVENVGFGGVLDYIQYYATSNLVYTPLYTKSLLFNKDIVRGEISFVGGGGVAKFAETGTKALVSIGLYVRFFTQEDRSWKFDFRNNVYFESHLGAVNSMSLMVQYSFHLGKKTTIQPTENMDDL